MGINIISDILIPFVLRKCRYRSIIARPIDLINRNAITLGFIYICFQEISRVIIRSDIRWGEMVGFVLFFQPLKIVVDYEL